MDPYLLQVQDISIGKHLKQIRTSKKLSQEQVAKELQRMGYTTMRRENISQIERGIANIRISLLMDLKKLYGVEHYDVFFEGLSPESDSSQNKKTDKNTIWKTE